jgi:hypothetical protein
MPLPRLGRVALSLALAAVLLAGCRSGPKKHVVSGTVLKGGKPLTVRPLLGRVRVVFDPQDAEVKGKMGLVDAVVKPDGAFTVPGPDNRGLPAGKYKVYVYQYDPFPPPPGGEQQADILKGAFAEGKSPLAVEVAPGSTELNIDLDKP